MATCPNRNLKDWKDLEASRGDTAYLLWDKYEGNVPRSEYHGSEALSKASPEVLDQVKAVTRAMGINLVALEDYAKTNPAMPTKGLNGVADLTKGVIAIAEGREAETLTEEMVHLATAMIEQTNPRLITEMISKIDRFNIYQRVFKSYKNKPAYQLGNGKPNIRKIKKEAVDQLIAEVIINEGNNNDQFPELRQAVEKSWVRRAWQTVLDVISGLYRKNDIDLFKTTANVIMTDGAGTVDNIQGEGLFFQVVPENTAVDEVYNALSRDHKSGDLIKINEQINPDGEVIVKRKYQYKGDDVGTSVTEKITKFDRPMAERKGLDKIRDDDKSDWGTAGHDYIENYILTNLVDKETGYALPEPKKVPITDTSQSKILSPEIKKIIEEYCKELIGTYPTGTKFLLENMMVNMKEKGGLASTLDFQAIIPGKNKKGEDTAEIDILDWKFTSVDIEKDDDIPWFKQRKWKKQMSEYVRMTYHNGAKPNTVRRKRMVPFILEYDNVDQLNPSAGIAPVSLSVGRVDSDTDTDQFLLPVPLESESTGNPEIDALVQALFKHHKRLYTQQATTPEERLEKVAMLNELSRGIRRLQVAKDFEPMVNIGKSYIEAIQKNLESYENLDYSTLTGTVINKKLSDLESYKVGLQKFRDLQKGFLSEYPLGGLSKEELETVNELALISTEADRILPEIQAAQDEYVMQLAVDQKMLLEAERDEMLLPEREVAQIAKSLLEGSKLQSSTIKLGVRVIEKSKNLVDFVFGEKMNGYQPILTALDKVAKSRGVDAFSLIGVDDGATLQLIKRLDSKFLKELAEKIEGKDKKFVISNVHMDGLNKDITALIKKQEEYLRSNTYSSDEQTNDQILLNRINAMKNGLDINRKGFNGWNNYHFNNFVNKHIKEEGNLSAEYETMKKTPEAFEMWEWFTAINSEALDMGYLGKEGLSFFPLIEATTLQKLGATDNTSAEISDLFRSIYTGRIEENKGYSRFDPETGEVRKSVPTYFTKTDMTTSTRLSKDMNLLGSLYQKAVLDYKNNKQIEGTLLTLYAVEKAKGRIILDSKGNITPGVAHDANKNLEILKVIIDDAVYGLNEEEGSIVNESLSKGVKKFSKNDDKEELVKREIAVKKLFDQGNNLTRMLGVGLKPAIAIANYFGFQFQSYVSAGGNYRFREFSKNNLKVTTGTMSTEERGLLHLLSPFTEDIVTLKRRDMAKDLGFLERLTTWTFTDVMMSTHYFPERALQAANALSFFENTMVVNGELVNIRKYVRAQDRAVRNSGVTIAKRQELKKTFQERVQKLKDEKALTKIVKVSESGVEIPGVNNKAMAEFRLKIQDYTRSLNGQMSSDNKANYRRNIMMRSFMMFKTWIPKLLSTRITGLKYDLNQEDWEYGRANLWFGTVFKYGLSAIDGTYNIIVGNEKGLVFMDELLREQQASHYAKYGKELTITKEEFYDLVQQQMANQMKELGLLIGMVGLVFAAKAAEPPEDATRLERNRYKYFLKMMHKIQDEISFYYDPTSFESITRGSILPALGLLSTAKKALFVLKDEVQGYVVGDQQMIDESHPTKYFINLIPGLAQGQNILWPMLDAEGAKDHGIIVTGESRRK